MAIPSIVLLCVYCLTVNGDVIQLLLSGRLVATRREYGENRFLQIGGNALERIERSDLLQRAQADDGEALASILSHYRPLIVSSASKWHHYGLDDAIQEASIAVIEAARTFDSTKGCYFGVFLRQRVRASLRTWGRRQARWAIRHTASSYTSASGGDSETVPIEDWADEKSVREVTAHEWRDWLHGLSPREKLVIQRHVIEGYPLVAIAEQESVSPHTVQTWKKRAMRKLRNKVATEA